MLRVSLVVGAALAGKPKMPDTERLRAQALDGKLTSYVHVKFEDFPQEELETKALALAESLGCATTEAPSRVYRAAGLHEEAHVRAGLNRWFKLACRPEGADAVTAAVAAADAVAKAADAESVVTSDSVSAAASSSSSSAPSLLEGIEHLSPGYVASLSYLSNDAFLSFQTHYDAIRLFEAWDLVPGGNPEVVVQVIDSGLDLSHAEFAVGTNVWVNSGEICGNGRDDDGNGFVDDCYGYNHADPGSGTELLGGGGATSHGTHCAGTIGMATDNAQGGAGIAGGNKRGNKGTSLMTSVVFGNSLSGGFAEALVYGADNGARISSNSWGYDEPDFFDQDVLDAIDYAVAKGVIVVFAAGNQGMDREFFPGRHDPVVAVTAVTNDNRRADFSNYGTWVDISAPGVDIVSTYVGNELGYMSGTSMATPHVAGLLALGIGANPAISNEAALACLYGTATYSFGSRNKLGAGMIHAEDFAKCVLGDTSTAKPSVNPALSPTVKPTTTFEKSYRRGNRRNRNKRKKRNKNAAVGEAAPNDATTGGAKGI